MRNYVNPGNIGFANICDENYVDKTMLISLINATIRTPQKLTCVSRPRRFGKSFAAQMLCAYYDCTCDSHSLFDDKKIAQDPSYAAHLNQYHVIYLDITSFISEVKINGRSLADVPRMIIEAIHHELAELDSTMPPAKTIQDEITWFVQKKDGRPFVFIIDEWDAMIREAKDDPAAQNAYLNLLRSWFKNGNFTPKAIAAAYMTGILPIKKDGSQSAISDFEEYSMLKPLAFGGYVGFTEAEVLEICEKKHVDFDLMKLWYDGYSFRNVGSVYNPNSVMKAARNDDFDSYWAETSAAEGLMEYISQDYNGLTKTIAELIAGIEVKVNPIGFANDLTTFRSKDDVLTLLIHLGYLAYDSEKKTARIPNEEIRQEFQRSIREVHHAETLKRLKASDTLFANTIAGDEAAVAAQIAQVHREETAPLHYNKEDSLRSVIKLAYYTYRDNYVQWEELPSGEGYADIAYLPKYDSDYPILLIELKWNKDVQTAIDQIKAKHYPDSFQGYGRDLILVGITYDKETKEHVCRIEKWQMD